MHATFPTSLLFSFFAILSWPEEYGPFLRPHTIITDNSLAFLSLLFTSSQLDNSLSVLKAFSAELEPTVNPLESSKMAVTAHLSKSKGAV